jgi:cysteine synthase
MGDAPRSGAAVCIINWPPDLRYSCAATVAPRGETLKSGTMLDAIGGTPLVRLKSLEPPNGAEIWLKLEEIAADLSDVDVLIAAVGTGAALMGTADGLRNEGVEPAVIALEPLQSPFLTTGKGGPHRVEGIGVGFEPPFLDRSRLQEIRAVDQERAFEMCRRLAREAGVFAGGSTGLNVAAAIDLSDQMGRGKRIVTLACDNGAKYLGGHIFVRPASR